MNDLLGCFIDVAIAALLAAVFYRLGYKDGYANGTRYSDTRFEMGKREGFEEAEAAYHRGYRQKRMGGRP
jgi:hypothetical protein